MSSLWTESCRFICQSCQTHHSLWKCASVRSIRLRKLCACLQQCTHFILNTRSVAHNTALATALNVSAEMWCCLAPRWSCERQGIPVTDKAQEFYADRHCQDIFKNFLVTITSRVNTLTGTAYRSVQRLVLQAAWHCAALHHVAGPSSEYAVSSTAHAAWLV